MKVDVDLIAMQNRQNIKTLIASMKLLVVNLLVVHIMMGLFDSIDLVD